MFHVELMKNYNILLFLYLIPLFWLQGCNKVDEAPESSDTVYHDLKSELDISTKQEEELKAQWVKDTKQFKETIPQSGMQTIHRNKMSTTENLLHIVQQQRKFFEIKMEQRRLQVRARYLESLKKNGRPWPDQKEIDDYKIRMKLQRDKFQWDNKNVPRGTEEKNRDPKPRGQQRGLAQPLKPKDSPRPEH